MSFVTIAGAVCAACKFIISSSLELVNSEISFYYNNISTRDPHCFTIVTSTHSSHTHIHTCITSHVATSSAYIRPIRCHLHSRQPMRTFTAFNAVNVLIGWRECIRCYTPKARFPSKRNRLRCVRCVRYVWMETRLNSSACVWKETGLNSTTKCTAEHTS